MADFNIDIIKEDCSRFDKLKAFYDTFNLTNLIKSETYYTNNQKSTIDLYFLSRLLPFQGTSTIETGLTIVASLYQFL